MRGVRGERAVTRQHNAAFNPRKMSHVSLYSEHKTVWSKHLLLPILRRNKSVFYMEKDHKDRFKHSISCVRDALSGNSRNGVYIRLFHTNLTFLPRFHSKIKPIVQKADGKRRKAVLVLWRSSRDVCWNLIPHERARGLYSLIAGTGTI